MRIGRSLGLMAAALAVLASPVKAQTYEVTVEGTFTQLYENDVLSDRQIDVPILHTWTFTMGRQAGFSPGSTRIEHGPDSITYRRSQIFSGGVIDLPVKEDATPPSLRVSHEDADAATRYREDWFGGSSRTLIQDKATGSSRLQGASWSLSSGQSWENSDGSLAWGNLFSVSQRLPTVVTPENFDDTMSPESFIALIFGGVGCADCLQINTQSWYSSGTVWQSLSANGRGTLLSVTRLASPVPEPASITLLLAGLAIVIGLGRRKLAERGRVAFV